MTLPEICCAQHISGNVAYQTMLRWAWNLLFSVQMTPRTAT